MPSVAVPPLCRRCDLCAPVCERLLAGQSGSMPSSARVSERQAPVVLSLGRGGKCVVWESWSVCSVEECLFVSDVECGCVVVYHERFLVNFEIIF